MVSTQTASGYFCYFSTEKFSQPAVWMDNNSGIIYKYLHYNKMNNLIPPAWLEYYLNSSSYFRVTSMRC